MPQITPEALGTNLLVLTKTNTQSRVHRPAYIDYIGIKRFDEHGKVIGEDRFIGLFSASIYNVSATQIPLINRKIERVMQMAQFEQDRILTKRCPCLRKPIHATS